MDITVLGSVAASCDGADIALGPRVRRLFARLVVDHDRIVSQSRLVDAVWNDDQPNGAERALKTYVSRLRTVIDPDGAGRIVYRDPGYQLVLDGCSLDSDAFEADLDVMRSLGVELVQGFWLGSPVPAEKIETLLTP